MTSNEEESFRALYATWPTERLARASTLEKREYLPEALALMHEELSKRGVTAEAAGAIVASAPPPLLGALPERDTWLFPARLTRRRYAIRASIFSAIVVAVAFALTFAPEVASTGFVVLALASLVYGALGLLLPRSKDAGFSSRLAMLFALIPITAVFTFLILFFTPSKR